MRKLSNLPGSDPPVNFMTRWYMNPATPVLGCLIFVYLLLYILPLGYRPLIIPDETRYAEIPREMLATGDWITPRLNGLRYFEKPPLGYWLVATSIAVIGENEFAVRFPGALAAGATTLIVFLFTLRVWRNRRTALAAALIYMTCGMVYVIGTFNVLDSFVTLFLTAGIYAFYLAATTPQKGSGSWKLWAISGLSFGLAFLVKGFLAFAIPALVLVPWMIWQGQWVVLLKKGWRVILAAILIALPWAILIHLREGDFWRYFFWEEHVRRFAADNAQHNSPVYYFLMFLPALAFPWLSLTPAAISGLREVERDGSEKPSTLRLLWLWLLLPFLFFSASNGKLVTYILPCFPPLAILTAVGLTEYLNRGRVKLFNFGMLFNVLVLLCLLAGSLIILTTDIGSRAYDVTERAKVFAIILSLLMALSTGLTSVLATRRDIKLASSLAMIVPFLFVISFVVPNETLKHKSPGQQLMQYRDRLTESAILISDATVLREVAWYLKRDDIYMISNGEVHYGGEAHYGLGYPEARYRYLNEERFKSLMEENASRRPVLMVCKRECPETLTAMLPPLVNKHVWGTFTFWFAPVAGISELDSGAAF
jgi:4-amino-4-deoxy-L-arabinose transferase